jgi:hypothetical protein
MIRDQHIDHAKPGGGMIDHPPRGVHVSEVGCNVLETITKTAQLLDHRALLVGPG